MSELKAFTSLNLIHPDLLLVTNTKNRDAFASSSADTFVNIKASGKDVTSSFVKGFEKYSIISGLRINIWRNETGAVSDTAVNSSAHLGMDEVEFTLPSSDIDINSIETLAKGENVDIEFVKTANIKSQNQKVQSFKFEKAQIVKHFFFLESGVTPSTTIKFKAKKIEVTRFSYDPGSDSPKGQKAYTIDLVSNTGK